MTDRPDFTEASSTVGRHRAQLEFGYTFVYDREGDERLSAHSYPETLLRVGVLAEWLELRVAWNYAVETMRTDGGSTTIRSPEDLYLGIKLGLTEQSGLLPEMALVPQTTVPTARVASGEPLPLPAGMDGFGAGELLPGVNWLYGWDVTSFLSCAGSTQVNRAHEGGDAFYIEFAQSFTVGYTLTEKLGAYTEWFAFFPHDANEARAEHYLNGGFSYQVTVDLQFDVRSGVGVNPSADDFFTGVGGAYRY